MAEIQRRSGLTRKDIIERLEKRIRPCAAYAMEKMGMRVPG